MFIETIIAVFLLGAIAGAWLIEIFRAGPLRSENASLRLRAAERAWMDEEEARNLARYRQHLGTPYIRTSLVDDHNGSRRAPSLEAVQ